MRQPVNGSWKRLLGAGLVTLGLLSGCGWGSQAGVNPEQPVSENPPADPDYPLDPDPILDPLPPLQPGPIGVPPRPIATLPPAPKPVVGTLRPLPKPTPTTPSNSGVPAKPDPEAAMNKFLQVLEDFGYEAGRNAASNVRMQIAIINRVPAERLRWSDRQSASQTFQRRVNSSGLPNGAWPRPISFEQWLADGQALARRSSGVSYYVARRGLYRDILRDRYNDTGDDAELILYKRLNRTPFFVCYRASGELDDYGYFKDAADWREFLPVPAAIVP